MGFFESKVEREAYIETFKECIDIVKNNDMQPKAMLQALSDFYDAAQWQHAVPFFSLARWIYNPQEAREKAILTAFELVDGIQSRYLS